MSKTVTLDFISSDMPLRQLLAHMTERHISHCQIPYSVSLSVHIVIMFDSEESSQLITHLDMVTARAIQKANARKTERGN